VATGPDSDGRGQAGPNGPEQPQPGRVRPISRRLLVALAVLGAAVGWTAVAAIERGGGVAPTVSWLTPVAWGFLAALLFLAARNTHQRIQVRRERVDPQRAVFLLMIAKASAFVGALCAGVYAGFALRFIDALTSSGPRNRTIIAGLSAVLAVLVVTAGLLLERACRVPRKPDETP
jgi:peptidoglycan/LPS O-acetylase OafA/YrhL